MYFQLKELLRGKIASGEWKPGDMVPSERELSEQYHISRMTARQALSELATEGLLRREQGRGTFVAKPKIEHGLTRLTGFTEDMEARGLQPGDLVIRLELIEPPLLAMRALQITPDTPVVLLKRPPKRLRKQLPKLLKLKTSLSPSPCGHGALRWCSCGPTAACSP